MKRHVIVLALLLLAAGVGVILWSLFGGQANADTVTLVPNEQEALKSFLTFGGVMIGTAIVMLIAIGRMG